MQTIAIVNEKGGTAKTTTTVNLAACLGKRGHRVLVVDLDGQGATSRWFAVENDARLAEALVRGEGLEPMRGVAENVDLAPACGQIDSVAHELRPTQGGQLRKLLSALEGDYDYAVIDCPPSLGNRLIGNALLAAGHAIAPVETSILALDGLRMLLTMLGDIRDGFGHDIRLMGILPCRYDARTKLSRLVLAELQRALPEHTFRTIIRANVKLQECPAAQQSILEYAPQSSAAEDYANLAREVEAGGPTGRLPGVDAEPTAYNELDTADRATLDAFRQRAARHLGKKPTPGEQIAGSGSGDVEGEAELGEEEEAAPVAFLMEDAGEAEAGAGEASETVDEGSDMGDDPAEAYAPPGRMGRRLAVSMASVGLVAVGLVAWAVFQSSGGPAPASASLAEKAGRAVEETAGGPESEGVGDPASATAPNEAADEGSELKGNTVQAGEEAAGNAAGHSETAASTGTPEDGRTAISDASDAAATMAAMRSMISPDGAAQAELASATSGEGEGRTEDSTNEAMPAGAPVSGEVEAETEQSESESSPRSARPMPPSLRLNGTIVRPDGGTAVVNGTVLREGEWYRGARLAEVNRDSVVLEYRGERYRLVLGGPAVSVDE